ncbi:MAG TPA: type III pantothenate kinase [Elusimicrobiota bacterium]|nr:type III pantothenate kinase [Elusimicrobiota bacterium]
MLLAVDIGNTQIALGLFKMDQGKTVKGNVFSWRMKTDRDSTADEYGIKILDLFHYASVESAAVKGLIIASVVPPLDRPFHDMAKKYFKRDALFIEPGVKTGINILYHSPSELGADRIVNAVAAYDMVKGAAIVVDFGTATTFDCITQKGEYLGGMIAPGILMSSEALAEKTAKLPRVDVHAPKSVIGKSTVESMRAGIFYGYIGLVEEIVRQLKKEMGGTPKVLATGGLASLMAPSTKCIKKVMPDMTLEGLRLIWDMNSNG